MNKFITNTNEKIDSGTEVLGTNLVEMQDANEKQFSNFYKDLFKTGILNTGNASTIFPVYVNNQGTSAVNISVGVGTGYIKDISSEKYVRIQIESSDNTVYNTYLPNQTTNNNDLDIATPKSSGCKNIPVLDNSSKYWIDIQYLLVCDNGNIKDSSTGQDGNLKNYSISKTDTKRFFKWIDGYNITLRSAKTLVQGLCLGTVVRTGNYITLNTEEDRSNYIIINPNVNYNLIGAGSGLTSEYENEVLKLNVNTDNELITVKNNKVTLTPQGQYNYTRFCVNKGPINVFELRNTESQIALLLDSESITLCPAFGDRFTITPAQAPIVYNIVREDSTINTTLTGYESLQEGHTYIVCVNNTDVNNNNALLDKPKIELATRLDVVDTKATSGTRDGLCLETLYEEIHAYYWNGTEWKEYLGVPIGEITITGD